MSFETKPKSGVIEYVPSVVRDYIDNNQEHLEKFYEKEELKHKFLSNNFSKYHIMQVSR